MTIYLQFLFFLLGGGPVVEGHASADATVFQDSVLWKELTQAMGYRIDVRYATTNNFTGAVIYPCGRFFLRREAANALEKARRVLAGKGYGLKLFDGYRPRPAQQKLWDKVPDRNYVAPPWEGSMHNRGVAVDLTLTDREGRELEMGTPYDFFGPEAHSDYEKLPEEVLRRRRVLREVMESAGFRGIRTEWWHFSLREGSFPLSSWEWSCPK